jgi:hypothetical protein
MILQRSLIILLFFTAAFSHASDVPPQNEENVKLEMPEEQPDFLDIRIRPYALLDSTVGAEFAAPIGRRFELGPTVHYFANSNDIRGSGVSSWEFGLKLTCLVWERSFREGVYLSGTFYEYLSQVVQDFPYAATGHFFTPGYAVTTGYQWRLGWFHSDRWTFRLGAGIGYRREHIESDRDADGGQVPLGIIERVQPTLDLTLGTFL